MTYTRAQATLKLARLLPNCEVIEGTATGGSTTTLVDTDITVSRALPDDWFNGGPIWFRSGNNDGKTATITDWANSTGTFTFATQSGACAASDLYAATNNDYPYYVLAMAINDALVDRIPNVPAEYSDATFITVSDQMDYNLPAGVYNVHKVEVATSTSTPYNYIPTYRWREIGGQISFDEGAQYSAAGYRIRLTYVVPPSETTADTDTINDLIHPDWLAWEAAVFCLRWKLGLKGSNDKFLATLLADAMANAERARRLHIHRIPILPPPQHPPTFVRAMTGTQSTEFNPGSARLT